jgi:uncharacterized repeat protein (TIGR01451 family)
MNTKRFTARAPIILGAVLVLLLLATTVSLAQSVGGDLTRATSQLTVGDSAVAAPKLDAAPPDAAQTSGLVPGQTTARPVSIIVTFDQPVSTAALEAAGAGTVVHQYSDLFDGASMVLPAGKIDSVAALPGVSRIYLDELQQLDTDASPRFIGATVAWYQLGGQSKAGEGVIVGILDSGIWPEHPSVADPDPAGKPYAAPPVVPGANGFSGSGPRSTCDFGNTAYNPNDLPFACNNKLIGAYTFLDTYKAVIGLLPTEFDSARDDNGHGSHTMTTAAGNGGVMATLLGVPRGKVSGIAPRAHVIAYRVCAEEGCYNSDSLAAVEQAVLDGVDVINFSISGGSNPFADIVEQAFAYAYDNGVFVAASAGNAGPGANTAAHLSPWVTTVAASTSNRHFISTLTLRASDNTELQLSGATVTDGIAAWTPVVYPPAGQELCLDPFPAGTFNGEIVICRRGVNARVLKGYNVAEGGAAGMILYNPVLQGLSTDNHFLPAVHLEGPEGVLLNEFMAAHTGVMATFTEGQATPVPGDVIAAFSSRGGPALSLGIGKPDITAPGVQILAAQTPLPATPEGGMPGQLFQAIQGTSMSSPHIAGSAALLVDMHPTWTPGQIKSALMTTAQTRVYKEDGATRADAFDTGSGRVDLSKAGKVSLTFDETVANYFTLADELWMANYPSLYLPNLYGTLTVPRTVHNETNRKATWVLKAEAPRDVKVIVPRVLHVPANGDATFDITVSAPNVPIGEVRFAHLWLKHGTERLHFPITIVRGEAVVTIDKQCSAAEIALKQTADCTITVTNTSLLPATVQVSDWLPNKLSLVRGSVVGATEVPRRNAFTFDGTLAPAGAPTLGITPGALSGYVPLAAFGIPPLGCPANCDDGGFVISGLDITYLGQPVNEAILSVNGTLELGLASGVYATYANQNLPDPATPNNILAPWWTDLNLTDAGQWYLGALTDGVFTYDIFEWAAVPRFGDPASTFSFQIWLARGTDLIWFAYGPATGDTGDGTVGAENDDGTVGVTAYYDGTGTLPFTTQSDLIIEQLPGTPGETHVISFQVKGHGVGPWTNCANMTSDLFPGTATSCFSGRVTPR